MAVVVPAEIWELIFADYDHLLVTGMARVCRGSAVAARLYHSVWGLHCRVYWYIDGLRRVLCSVNRRGEPHGWMYYYNNNLTVADFYNVGSSSTCQQMMLLHPYRIYLIDLGNCMDFPNMPLDYRRVVKRLHRTIYTKPRQVCRDFMRCIDLAVLYAEDDHRWICTNGHFLSPISSDEE